MTPPQAFAQVGARAIWGSMVLLCAAALAAALVTQHVFEMQPCPWCVLQRLEFVLIGLVALLGAVWTVASLQRIFTLLAGALGAAGIATALWHYFVAASSASCDLTLADRIMSATGLDMALPEVFAAFASCADAKTNLLGIPYAFWSLGLFAVLVVMACGLWIRTRRTA